MENRLMITILMAVYNTPARMLQDCWESILAQTWPHWRLMLVDDGSDLPETLAWLGRLKDDQRVCLIRQEHQGLAVALNTGLEASPTELVARMDADDIMLPDRLALQTSYMLEHPEVDILGGQIELFDDQTGQIQYQTKHPKEVTVDDIRQKIQAGQTPWFLNHPAVMYRRNRILALGGYNPTFRWAQDFDLWLRALQAGYVIRNLPSVVVRYRRHDGQISNYPTAREHDLAPIQKAKQTFMKAVTEREGDGGVDVCQKSHA